MKRYYALTKNGRRVHYRRDGEGPPLVMLHSSPSSSKQLEPRMAGSDSDPDAGSTDA